MESRARLRGPARIHCIQALRDCIMLVPVEELRNRRDVQFTSRNPEAARGGFRPTENVVGYRDCGFHASSITRVIPDRNRFLEFLKRYVRELGIASVLPALAHNCTSRRLCPVLNMSRFRHWTRLN